jgi:RHS repeat-associated protein
VLASSASDGGGYVDLDADGSAWLPSTRTYYAPTAVTPTQELASAQAHFFLPQLYIDPFGQATAVVYDDPNDMLPVSVTDAAGNVTAAAIDYRVLAPDLLTDANGNQTAARYDAMGQMVGAAVMGKSGQGLGDSFTTFDPDPNQAQIDAFFNAADPHALAAPLLGTATTRIIYDLRRYFETSQANPSDDTTWQPVYAATLSREIHESDLTGGAVSPIQISFCYSDGFGREIQKKVEAESAPGGSGPRWIGDGWTVLNNKAKPVRQYEPFFSALASAGHRFEFAVLSGVSPILVYDPLDRVVATVHPDQTFEKVVFDPWTQTKWDVNDTLLVADPATDADVGGYLARLPPTDLTPTWFQQRAGGALGADQQAAAVQTQPHAGTPSVVHLDTLARTVLTIADNGAFGRYATRVQFDIQGRKRAITDALGRTAATFDYDMLGAQLRQTSMEAGQRWALNDVAGNPIRTWDSRGHNRRNEYDVLRRPIARHVLGADPVNSDLRTLAGEVCYEMTVYGEGQVDDQALNLRTRVYQLRDPTGLTQNSAPNPASTQIEAFDFKGNRLRATRQFVAAVNTLTDWSGAPPAFGPAWTSAATYDALNRAVTSTTPDGAVSEPNYNARNLLQAINVTLEGAASATPCVVEIDYDAKGRRLAVAYGNTGTNTVYGYDPLTFRLTSLTTTRPSFPAGQQSVQALNYVYDPKGNVTHIQDDADLQDTVYFRNRRVDPSANYGYDPIYRLIAASGREQLGLAGGSPQAPAPTSYNDAPRIGLISPGDGQAMGTYAESYGYDAVGNFQTFTHKGANPSNPGWTRSYAYNEASLIAPAHVSNRLSSTTISGSQAAVEPYAYDPDGNMTAMPQLQAMGWDFLDQLLMTRRQAVNGADADGALHAGERTYFAYGADGKRARKSTVSSAGVLTKQRWYFAGGWELYQEYNAQGAVSLELQTLSVMDGARRVVMINTTTVDVSAVAGGLPSVAARYQYDNHMGSACLELDETGAVVTYEEYYPFGGTSYQAGRSLIEVSLKRYRFSGKERDVETGLSYHGARYCATWLGRWTACDPAGYVDGPNLYLYCHANPVVLTDPGGTQATPNAQGSDPDIHYHPLPTLEERAATALGDYHLTLDPLPAADFKRPDFAALYRAIYGLDPSAVSPSPSEGGGGPTNPPAPDWLAPVPPKKKDPEPKPFDPPDKPEFRLQMLQFLANKFHKRWIGSDLAFGVGQVRPLRHGLLSVNLGILSGDSGTDIPGFATPDPGVKVERSSTFPFVEFTPDPYADTSYYEYRGPYSTLAESAPIQWYDPDPSVGIHLKYTPTASKLAVGFTFGFSPANLPVIGDFPNYTPISPAALHAGGDLAAPADLALSNIFNYNYQTDAGLWVGGRFYITGW